MTDDRQIRKILFVRLSSLGDILHVLPTQQALHRHAPDLKIHWLAERAFVPLLERVPGIDRIWSLTLRNGGAGSLGRDLVATVQALRRERFDVTIDFQGLLKSAFLARLSRPRRLVGFDSGATREKAAAWFYSERIRPEGLKLHAIELNSSLLGSIASLPAADPRIPLDIPQPAARRIAEELGRRNLEEFVILNIGGGWVTKLWPPSAFAQLADLIRERLNVRVLVTFGPGEEGLVEELQSRVRIPVDAFPTDVFELAALCRQARLMVSGDTGPLHLAVAMGTPTVAILGPTSPWRNGPFNAADIVVRRQLPCSDCYKRSCNKFICMQITAAEVFEAVRRRMNQ